MDNRFTLKDAVYLAALAIVIAAILYGSWRFSYQEERLNDVLQQLNALNDTGKRQEALLAQIANHGVSTSETPSSTGSATTQTATSQPAIIHTKNPDGSETVYAPQVPIAENDPRGKPDYATGDWLVDNLGDEPGTITPYLARTVSDWAPANNICEPLLTQNRFTFEWQPYVAESYTAMPDHVTFRFVIRKGVTFSDGVPLTADDVVFTYNTIMNKDVDADPERADLKRLKSCRKIDDRTVEMVFGETYFKALGICSFPILPEHIYKFTKAEDFNNNKETVLGSGPYVIERWDRGQKLVLARNEHYWGPRPTFDKLVYVFIMNPQAALQSFQNGMIDQDAPDPEQWERLMKDAAFTSKYHCYKFIAPDAGYRFIGWNEKRPMFADKLTRQALTMLIDRAGLIKTISRNLAMMTACPFNPNSEQTDHSIQPWPYDPDGAKKKLAEAGWTMGSDGILVRDGKPFKFEFTIPASAPIYEKNAVYIKQQLASAGISMTITPYEFSVLSDHLDTRNFDAAMLGWSASADEEDPTSVWSSDGIKGKGQNFISYHNEQVDALIESAVHEMDRAKRMKLWHQMDAIIHDEQPYTFMQVGIARDCIAPRIANTTPDKMGLDSGAWYVPAAQQRYH